MIAKHCLGLRIPYKGVPVLAKLHNKDEDKQPIDFGKRYLYRVFTRGSFKKGCRFMVVGGRMLKEDIDYISL